MSNVLKNIIRFILFILLQIYVLDKVPPLHQFIVPILYFLFILWLPFTINHLLLICIAFFYGMTLDYFNGYPGFHAIPCVFIAYIRPFLLNLMIRQDNTEQSYIEPSFKSMGAFPYSIYILVFTLLHHSILILVEWLEFGNFIYFIAKLSATTSISLLLIFLTEMLFYRKAKFKTNAE